MCAARAVRLKLLKVESVGTNALAEIAPVKPHVIRLCEVTLAIWLLRNLRIFVSVLPCLNDGYHRDEATTGSKNSLDFLQCSFVVHMLEHVIGDDDIDGTGRKSDVFDVQGDGAGLGFAICGLVGCALVTDDARQTGFWCKVENPVGLGEQRALVQREAQQTVAL